MQVLSAIVAASSGKPAVQCTQAVVDAGALSHLIRITSETSDIDIFAQTILTLAHVATRAPKHINVLESSGIVATLCQRSSGSGFTPTEELSSTAMLSISKLFHALAICNSSSLRNTPEVTFSVLPTLSSSFEKAVSALTSAPATAVHVNIILEVAGALWRLSENQPDESSYRILLASGVAPHLTHALSALTASNSVSSSVSATTLNTTQMNVLKALGNLALINYAEATQALLDGGILQGLAALLEQIQRAVLATTDDDPNATESQAKPNANNNNHGKLRGIICWIVSNLLSSFDRRHMEIVLADTHLMQLAIGVLDIPSASKEDVKVHRESVLMLSAISNCPGDDALVVRCCLRVVTSLNAIPALCKVLSDKRSGQDEDVVFFVLTLLNNMLNIGFNDDDDDDDDDNDEAVEEGADESGARAVTENRRALQRALKDRLAGARDILDQVQTSTSFSPYRIVSLVKRILDMIA